MENPDINLVIIATVIAVVVIVALLLAKRVGFSLTKGGVSLSADKNNDKDTVSVKKINKSSVEVENRKDQNVDVEDVSNSSNVKIK